MPELPEVENFRKYLELHSHGQPILGVETRSSSILSGLSVSNLNKSLGRHHFTGTSRHGKYLFATLETGTSLVIHFGMTGGIVRVGKGDKDPPYSRFLIRFAGSGSIVYTDPRKFGRIYLTDDIPGFVGKKDLGPDALSIDKETFIRILSPGKGRIKSMLMDQHLIAGIGNIYSDEILFQAGIHPLTPLPSLRPAEMEELYEVMTRVLSMAIQIDGHPDTIPEDWLLRYRKSGLSCPCGGKVERISLSGRYGYFCPACQPAR